MTVPKTSKTSPEISHTTTYYDRSHAEVASFKSAFNKLDYAGGCRPNASNQGHLLMPIPIACEVPAQYVTWGPKSQRSAEDSGSDDSDGNQTVENDPVQREEWGPATITIKASSGTVKSDPAKKDESKKNKKGRTTKNGYLEGYKPPKDDARTSDSSATEDEVKPSKIAETEKMLKVTTRSQKDSMSSTKVGQFKTKDGKEGTRKTFVTLVRMTVVQEEVEADGDAK